MLKKLVAVFAASAVALGCFMTVGYAAEQTSGTKWEVVANTGFEGAKTSFNDQKLHGSNYGWGYHAVNTGDIIAVNPDGWYTLKLDGATFAGNVGWSNVLNSNVFNIKL